MLSLLLFLILIWIVAGIVGFVVEGLFWLFILACVLFAVTLLTAGYRHGRLARHPRR